MLDATTLRVTTAVSVSQDSLEMDTTAQVCIMYVGVCVYMHTVYVRFLENITYRGRGTHNSHCLLTREVAVTILVRMSGCVETCIARQL